MSLAQGRPYLAIPGPSVMPDRVLAAMMRPAPNIYHGALPDMVATLYPDLNAVARSSGRVAIYIANGHGAWEAALANTLAPGARVLSLLTGHFGRAWGRMAETLGAEVDTLDFGLQSFIDPDRVEAALRADRSHEIRAVLCTQVDTATGVRNDLAAVRAAIDAAGHPALFMVDSIACLGCDPFEMDLWGVDVMVSACQKGLMTPPGLAFVHFGPRAAAQRDRLERVSPYWDWRPRTDAEQFYQLFCGTAPTHLLFALRAALDMLLHEEGLAAALARHARLAEAVWAAFETWAVPGGVSINIADRAARSHAITALRCDPAHGSALREWVEREAGVTLGIGLGMAPPDSPERDGFFRLGHMGHVNAHMVLGALGAIEAGMRAVGLPHAPGGLAAAAEVCARPAETPGASAGPMSALPAPRPAAGCCGS